jgi:hypothetical protein
LYEVHAAKKVMKEERFCASGRAAVPSTIDEPRCDEAISERYIHPPEPTMAWGESYEDIDEFLLKACLVTSANLSLIAWEHGRLKV